MAPAGPVDAAWPTAGRRGPVPPARRTSSAAGSEPTRPTARGRVARPEDIVASTVALPAADRTPVDRVPES
ncbi:hypothetical protein, partial [Pseudonocardia alni]|uniref:hypothetical protein n=1 Tax=Pseudonocardia alni TaxID=33907 RepID=UPI001AD6B2D6